MANRAKFDFGYLTREALLFLGLSYILLLGGTFNGLVLFRIKLVTFVLAAGGVTAWQAVRFIKGWEFPNSVLDPAVAIFLGAQIVSTLASDDPRRSLLQLGQLVLFALIFYTVVEAVRHGFETDLVFKVMILVSGFVIVFGIWELGNWYWGWWEIAGGSRLIPPATYRVRAFLGHPNFTAAYLNLVLPLGLAGMVRSRPGLKRVVLGGWIAAVLGLIFFTSSRGGWIGTAAVLGTFVFFLIFSRMEIALLWIRQRLQTPWKLVVLIAGTGALLTSLILVLRWQSEHPTHPTSWDNIIGSRDYIWGPAWDLFKQHPLLGNGPFTFGTEYLRYHSVPPSMILAHAHNYYLNVLAESGLFGLAGLVTLIGSILFLSLKSWKQHQYLSRIQMGSLFAGLAGISLHSLVETPQTLPAIMIILAVYVGMLASDLQPTRRGNLRRTGSWMLAAAAAVMLLGWGWSLAASRPYYLALDAANQQKRFRAEALFESVLKRDRHHALYWFQAGLNHGNIAADLKGSEAEARYLSQAREAYQKGLALEPNYSVNWMNLGLVYWQEGRKETGLEAVSHAVEQAPRQAGFQLTYGHLLEEAGRTQQAEEAYFGALDLHPEWAESAYFRRTAVREQAVYQWKLQRSGEYQDAAGRVSDYLETGLIDSAREFISRLPRRNNPEAYYLLGLTEKASGNFEDAETALRTARWMDPKDPWQLVEINIALGDLYHLQENHQAAAEAYILALSGIERYGSFGFGTLGVSEYGWYIYYRPAAVVDLLPGFEVILYPDQVVEDMPDMITSLTEAGEIEKARDLAEVMMGITWQKQ